MTMNIASLDSLVQEKIAVDAEFQSQIATLSEDEKTTAIELKKSELMDLEISSLSEQAKKAAKFEEDYKSQKVRAEKAELLNKIKPPTDDKKPVDDSLNQKDLIVLINAKVPEDDIDDVVQYAKFKNIPIAEALKSTVIRTTLAEKEEFRKSAAAANTAGAKRATQAATPERLMSDLSEGKIPEKGSKEAEDLFWARRGGKR